MFPYLYRTHHGLHPGDIHFWLELAAERPGPILELGCGTGRVLVPLASAGRQVYGLDRDFDMLAVLQQYLLPELRSNVFVFQADFTGFRLARQFGLILLTCNTFSTLDFVERQAVLKCVLSHLQPNGLFAVSLPNPRLLKRLPAHADAEIDEIFAHPQDGEPVQVSSAWERTERSFILHWYYDHLLPDGRVERVHAETRHWLTSTESYLEEVRVAGFRSPVVYGDFDRSPLTPTSPHLIILASS